MTCVLGTRTQQAGLSLRSGLALGRGIGGRPSATQDGALTINARNLGGDMTTIDQLSPEQITRIDDENRAMWGRTAVTYADGFEAMTGAAAEATLDAAGVGFGSHVLDVG